MTFVTYRNGGGELEQRIKAAIAAFYRERGGLPAAVVVHKSEVADAREALDTLDLSLEVRGSGGCLVGEVWLELPKEKGGQSCSGKGEPNGIPTMG